MAENETNRLTVIGEPIPDTEAPLHLAAARDLTEAIAETAPRGFSGRLILAADTPIPTLTSARATIETVPSGASLLPRIWRSNLSARPLDGEFVHAVTPLAPLRQHDDYDGSQNTLMVPHTLAWDAPELLGEKTAKNYRTFVERAVELADVVLAPTHAVASRLTELFDASFQVLPLAAPQELRAGADSESWANAASLRRNLGIADRYIVTTAWPGDSGRLEWLFEALRANPSLPQLVVLRCENSAGMDATGKGSVNSAAGSDANDADIEAETQTDRNQTGEVFGVKTPITARLKLPFLNKESDETSALPEVMVPEDLADRVNVISTTDLTVLGQVLSGALLLASPQLHIGAGFEVLGAIESRLPVVHAGNEAVAEMALDAGVLCASAAEFGDVLVRLTSEVGRDEYQLLRLFADDRSAMFSWQSTAFSLWDLHASI